MDANKLIDGMFEMLSSMNPRSVNEVNEAIQQVEQVLGMRIREDVLSSLGDVWTLHTAAALMRLLLCK